MTFALPENDPDFEGGPRLPRGGKRLSRHWGGTGGSRVLTGLGWAGLGCSAGAVAALDSPVESVPCPVRTEPVARGSLCLR